MPDADTSRATGPAIGLVVDDGVVEEDVVVVNQHARTIRVLGIACVAGYDAVVGGGVEHIDTCTVTRLIIAVTESVVQHIAVDQCSLVAVDTAATRLDVLAAAAMHVLIAKDDTVCQSDVGENGRPGTAVALSTAPVTAVDVVVKKPEAGRIEIAVTDGEAVPCRRIGELRLLEHVVPALDRGCA